MSKNRPRPAQALFDEPGLLSARQNYKASLKATDTYATLTDKDAKGVDPTAKTLLAKLYDETVLQHRCVRAATSALLSGQSRLALTRKLAEDAARAVLHMIVDADAKQLSAYGAIALRRDARALQTALASLLPPEESLDDGANDADRAPAFRTSLRPEFNTLNVALNLLNLETPADVKAIFLSRSGVTRADLNAVLCRRKDFERNAIRAALDTAALAPTPPGDDAGALHCFRLPDG